MGKKKNTPSSLFTLKAKQSRLKRRNIAGSLIKSTQARTMHISSELLISAILSGQAWTHMAILLYPLPPSVPPDSVSIDGCTFWLCEQVQANHQC